MTKRRLLLSLATATALTATSCGAGTQDTADSGATVPVLDPQAVEQEPSPLGGLRSEAAPGTSQSSTSLPTTEVAPDSATPTKPATQPDRAQTRLGSSVLAATLDPDAQTSARFEARIEMVSAEYSEPVIVTMRGAFDLPNQASEFEFDLSGMEAMFEAETDGGSDDELFADFGTMFSDPMRMITIGDEAWMQWGFLGFLGVEEDQWLAMDADSEEAFSPDDLGFGGLSSPTDILDSMKELDASIEDLGTETIHGVETRHLRATVDPNSLNPSEQAEFEENFGELPTEALPIDFWIGEDGLLYRFSISMSGTDLGSENDFESFSMTFDMFDYGADLGITPPDPSTVVDEDSLGFD